MIHRHHCGNGVGDTPIGQGTGTLFSYIDLEDRISVRLPLRKIRAVVNDALRSLDGEFDRLYAGEGRPSIVPERLLRASLLQIFHSVRSEGQLMEQMDYKLLFRWFVGLGIDDTVWIRAAFSKNRDRFLTTDMSRRITVTILAHREVAPLLSDDHFSVDGTLVKVWASKKSFRPKDKAVSGGETTRAIRKIPAQLSHPPLISPPPNPTR